MQSNCCLKDMQIFHSDRGNEFNNKIINKMLNTFQITKATKQKGCPYDNAVALKQLLKLNLLMIKNLHH